MSELKGLIKEVIDITTISKEEHNGMLPYIETYMGLRLYYNNITPESISIFDIAHALSQICRFTGHTKEFYSVAQHSVLVCEAQETVREQRAGLLHDASEAYVNDLPSPMKSCINLGDYKLLENQVHAAINTKFMVNDGMTPNIKKADLRALFTEKRDVVMSNIPYEWGKDIKPFDETIIPLQPKEAEKLFLDTFARLFPIEYADELLIYKK
jgi:5'-deoxynucleotidase YfbR-like HD superfamily hydrolase